MWRCPVVHEWKYKGWWFPQLSHMRTDAWNNWIQAVNMDVFPQTFRWFQKILNACVKKSIFAGRPQRNYSTRFDWFAETIVKRKRSRIENADVFFHNCLALLCLTTRRHWQREHCQFYFWQNRSNSTVSNVAVQVMEGIDWWMTLSLFVEVKFSIFFSSLSFFRSWQVTCDLASCLLVGNRFREECSASLQVLPVTKFVPFREFGKQTIFETDMCSVCPSAYPGLGDQGDARLRRHYQSDVQWKGAGSFDLSLQMKPILCGEMKNLLHRW